MDVFFYEIFEEELQAVRSRMPDNLTASFTAATIQESTHTKPPSSIISIRTQSRIPETWLPHLSAVISRSTGYDHLSEYRNSVACGYLPHYCSRSVAEHAMLLWSALLRKLPRQILQFSTFNRDGLTGRETLCRNLLVVGVGSIGSEIAGIGKALNMNVMGVDIVRRFEEIHYVDFDHGCRQADVIVCSMNLTSHNRAYFSYERLKNVRPGCVFINIARGELSPAADLLQLLEQGLLGGVGLDVFDDECSLAGFMRTETGTAPAHLATVMKLYERSDVILTPHNAFNTHESVDQKAAQTVEQICSFLETSSFRWPVPIA